MPSKKRKNEKKKPKCKKKTKKQKPIQPPTLPAHRPLVSQPARQPTARATQSSTSNGPPAPQRADCEQTPTFFQGVNQSSSIIKIRSSVARLRDDRTAAKHGRRNITHWMQQLRAKGGRHHAMEQRSNIKQQQVKHLKQVGHRTSRARRHCRTRCRRSPRRLRAAGTRAPPDPPDHPQRHSRGPQPDTRPPWAAAGQGRGGEARLCLCTGPVFFFFFFFLLPNSARVRTKNKKKKTRNF
jgi:hypothetical protein